MCRRNLRAARLVRRPAMAVMGYPVKTERSIASTPRWLWLVLGILLVAQAVELREHDKLVRSMAMQVTALRHEVEHLHGLVERMPSVVYARGPAK